MINQKGGYNMEKLFDADFTAFFSGRKLTAQEAEELNHPCISHLDDI